MPKTTKVFPTEQKYLLKNLKNQLTWHVIHVSQSIAQRDFSIWNILCEK